jgi:hypothetical protein
MRIVNNEFETIWKEAAGTYLKCSPTNRMIVNNKFGMIWKEAVLA